MKKIFQETSRWVIEFCWHAKQEIGYDRLANVNLSTILKCARLQFQFDAKVIKRGLEREVA